MENLPLVRYLSHLNFSNKSVIVEGLDFDPVRKEAIANVLIIQHKEVGGVPVGIKKDQLVLGGFPIERMRKQVKHFVER